MADRHPDVVKAMRDYYEGWWKGLEPTLNDFVPISIGAKQQPVVELTSGDWEGIYADNTGYVREAVGGPTGGHWHIRVEEAGRVRVHPAPAGRSRRRRPWATSTSRRRSRRPTRPKRDDRSGSRRSRRANIEIAGVTAKAQADPKATGATSAVKLPAGKTTLKAWFADADGKDLCGAFFVTVVRKP